MRKKNVTKGITTDLFGFFIVYMNNSNIDIDQAVLVRLKDGCRESFEQLFLKYNPKIYNFAYSILFDKSLAEDITQSCFLKIWELRSGIDPEKSFQAYLYTIARNLVYKETERKMRMLHITSLGEEDVPVTNNGISEQIDADLCRSHIDKMVESLPPARKRIFILSREHGLSYKDIAAQLAISEKTVETQITRTLAYLRKNMKEYLTGLALYFIINSL